MTKGRTTMSSSRKHSEREHRAKLSIAHFAWAALVLPLAAASACATTEVEIGTDCANGFCDDAGSTPPPPSFTPPPPDGGDGGTHLEEPPKILACIGTECVFPYADCSKSPSFRCETNLMNDPANCGACGVSCGGFGGINMGASCVQGKCAFECQIKSDPNTGENWEFRDCNGLLDDGCEVNISADPENCGACGNACAPGVRCIKGKCGCPAGLTDCGRCTDTRFDDYNCATCGNYCTKPADACNPMPFQTVYGCGLSQCGKLKCKSGYADCNHDLNKGCASDGCETNTKTDTKNCGGCGIECAPDQDCRDDGYGPQCLDKCEKAGLTLCTLSLSTVGCKDLLSDKANCGACGNTCPNPRANQVNACKKGLCVLECIPGWADCNGDPSDGCEVNIMRHPANCGACGHACDFASGQPCIEGKCLMVECDGGIEVTK